MATAHNRRRPMAPHLQVYRWGPAMTVSILHRATGSGMATVGTILLVAWLALAASGASAYDRFIDWFTLSDGRLNIVGWILGVGLSWAFFQHLASGVRHLFMDLGANYELKGNKASATSTFLFSILATAGFWAFIIWGRA